MSKFVRLALLGDPVAHSRSPAIHRAAMTAAGIEGEYDAIRSDVEDLGQYVEELRSGDLTGVNVTMPLKAAAAALADHLTEPADTAGSVNTLRAREGIVEAHSTDAVAFAEILADVSRFASDAPVLILGSGGSARAALASLSGRETYISARTREKAERLARRFGMAGVVEWGRGKEASLLVNATPLGMRGEELPERVLASAQGLIDLPYGGHPTPAISIAAASGLPHVDGLEFLARQARASFEWWTGEPVDLKVLIRAARND